MDKIKLEDIIPAQSTFTLTKTNKVYRLRPPTLEDQVWIGKKFATPQAMVDMINKRDWKTICEFVYHQMSMSARKDFLFGRVRLIDDEGRETVKEMTGPEKLLYQLTTADGVSILKAINRCIADSNPMVEKAMMVDAKKKLKALNKLR